MRVSILGGAGFVGTNLCKLLEEKNIDFEIIDIKPSSVFLGRYKFGDVRDLESLRRTISGDVVVNLAAVHRDDVSDSTEYFDTNVMGAKNIVLVSKELGICKIVFTSSVAVYGFSSRPTDEHGTIAPFNSYGQSKFSAEEIFRSWHSEDKKSNSLIIIRPTVIFGEGNRGNVYNLFRQIASGRFLMFGDGTNKKSMAYIKNVVSFIHAGLMCNDNYIVSNYVDSPSLTMNELVSKARLALLEKKGVGFRMPYVVGAALGAVADILSVITRRKLPISYIRVKKFASSTEFTSTCKFYQEFQAPFSMMEAIDLTIEQEFISPDPNREVFYT